MSAGQGINQNSEANECILFIDSCWHTVLRKIAPNISAALVFRWEIEKCVNDRQ